MTREEALKLLGGVLQGYLLKDDINQIYNDHEAQLKLASDVYSTDKMHMYQELKAKDEEIRRLNNLYADTIKELGKLDDAYSKVAYDFESAVMEIERLKIETKKARSIVAMLFWEWKKSQRWAGKNHFASKGNEDAFKKAYKMLKDTK